ncbi:hypothetical protein ACT4WS_19555 (plasmid) [Acinetobacter baumannii]
MKSENIKFSSLVLLSFIISGCGSISKTTFNELKQEAANDYADSYISSITKPLNYSVNTPHNVNGVREVELSEYERNLVEEKKPIPFNYGNIPFEYAKKCIYQFDLKESDINKNYQFLRDRTDYTIKDIPEERQTKFRNCLQNQFETMPVEGTRLNIFLTEPNLQTFKIFPEFKRHLDVIKKDNMITLKEIVDTYDILMQLEIKQQKEQNMSMLKNL